MVFAIGVLGTSCDNKKPEFKYQVDVGGQLAFVASETVSTFTAFVSNTTTPTMLSASPDVSAGESSVITSAAEEYFEAQIKAALPTNTYYNITIKGYVTEKLTGITVAINKTFNNFPDNFEVNIKPLLEDSPGVPLEGVPDTEALG